MAELPRPDDEHGPDTGGVPDLPPEWAGIVIPDDASELAAETEALRRERRRDHRRDRIQAIFATRRWQRYGLSGPVIALSVLVAGIFGSLLFLLPTGPSSPREQQLARPTAAPGSVGGLLPDLQLATSTGSTVRTRDLRPAVVLVLPEGCACDSLVDQMVLDTTTGRIAVLVVTEGSGTPRPLPNSAPRERVTSAADPQQLFDRALAIRRPSASGSGPRAAGAPSPTTGASSGAAQPQIGPAQQAPELPPTGVFVRSDGKINSVLTTVQDRQNLSGEIDQLID